MRADGSEVEHLAPSDADDAVAEWSGPAGRIVFESRRESPEFQIFTMLPDGSGILRLTHTFARNYHPDWSPDGQSITFVSERDGTPELYTMRADGTDQRRLTQGLGRVSAPHWSPDGTLILFAAEYAGQYDLFITTPDGARLWRVTDHPANDYSADWQP
jgi:TolB protein